MSVTPICTGIQNGAAVCSLADGTIAVASGPGVLQRFDRTGTRLDELTVDPAPAALAPLPTGNGVLGLAPATGLWAFRFGTGEVLRLSEVRGGRAMAADPVSSTALVGRSPGGGQLVRLPLAPGTGPPRTVSDATGRPHAIAARVGGTSAWVLVGGGSRSLLEVDLAGGAVAAGSTGHQIFGLGDAGAVAWIGTAGTVLAVGGASGRILLVDTARPTAAPRVLADGLEPVWGLDLLPPLSPGDPAQLVAGIGEALALIDVPDPISEVVLELPTTPLYLSGWARVGVTLDGGRTLDDLVFAVEPPEGASVSVSRDAAFDHRPAVVLAASATPGRYELTALDRDTGDKLAVASFKISDVWNGQDGPPLAVIGEQGADAPDPAWGGGDPNVPQNLNVVPQRGKRKVAVVVVESSDVTALSGADQATLRTEWTNEIFDGVVRDGVTESTRAYYRDVSDGVLDLENAGVVGVTRLTGTWASYAPTVDDASTGKTGDWSFYARAVVADLRRQNEAAASAGDPPVVDLTKVDSVVLVVRSLPGTPATPTSPAMPGRFMWPSATIPGGYQLTFEIGRRTISQSFPWGTIATTVPISRSINMFSMPDDWEIRPGSSRTRRETATHEMAHNLGLPDEYSRAAHAAAFKSRDLAASTTRGASWSLMSWEQRFPQMTVVEKMMLGWIKREHVRNLSFATLGPVDRDIDLHASDEYPPPANQFAAVEVRISDGINYYFEYRRENPSETSDEDVPADNTVVGLHCWSGKEPADHRNILRIKNDSDNDNGEFQAGDSYREEDTSDPSYPNDFSMNVLSTGDDSATIHITYGDKKPDPQIRPWAPSTNWKSPDLRVTNDRNRVDSRYRDIPWEGHDNRLVATVRNPAGQLNARSVRVDFFVKDFTLGRGEERQLGSDVHDVPAGAQVDFTSSVAWVPPPLTLIPFVIIPVHYCVVARIAEYHDPLNPAVGEITRDNNEAQSNHTQVISVSASPSTRETGFVKVTNPLEVTANCRVQVRQTSPFARTYLEHAWVRLAPGEERDVMFLTESMLGDPVVGQWASEHEKEIYETPNSIRLTGIVDQAEVCHGFVTGGAQVLVRSARATRFISFEMAGPTAMGEIRAVDDAQGATGTVLVSMWPPGSPEKGRVAQGRVENGFFEFGVEGFEEGMVTQAHYLGSFDLAPCDSEVLSR